MLTVLDLLTLLLVMVRSQQEQNIDQAIDLRNFEISVILVSTPLKREPTNHSDHTRNDVSQRVFHWLLLFQENKEPTSSI
jgi:hypothetical protein